MKGECTCACTTCEEGRKDEWTHCFYSKIQVLTTVCKALCDPAQPPLTSVPTLSTAHVYALPAVFLNPPSSFPLQSFYNCWPLSWNPFFKTLPRYKGARPTPLLSAFSSDAGSTTPIHLGRWVWGSENHPDSCTTPAFTVKLNQEAAAEKTCQQRKRDTQQQLLWKWEVEILSFVSFKINMSWMRLLHKGKWSVWICITSPKNGKLTCHP